MKLEDKIIKSKICSDFILTNVCSGSILNSDKQKTRPHHTNGVDAPLIMDGSNTYIQTYIRMDKRFEEQKRSHL